MKKILLIMTIIALSACDNNSTKSIEGIKFNKEETAILAKSSVTPEQMRDIIKDWRKNGSSDDDIKKYLLTIKSVGFDPVKYIEDTAREDKNRFYTACYDEYSKSIKTFDEREFMTKYCNCAAECVLDGVKWVNNMPLSLFEEDEKDKGKVEMAWVELENRCKEKCLKLERPKK